MDERLSANDFLGIMWWLSYVKVFVTGALEVFQDNKYKTKSLYFKHMDLKMSEAVGVIRKRLAGKKL